MRKYCFGDLLSTESKENSREKFLKSLLFGVDLKRSATRKHKWCKKLGSNAKLMINFVYMLVCM